MFAVEITRRIYTRFRTAVRRCDAFPGVTCTRTHIDQRIYRVYTMRDQMQTGNGVATERVLQRVSIDAAHCAVDAAPFERLTRFYVSYCIRNIRTGYQ